MIAYVRSNNVYLGVPKNGIATFVPFLRKYGYKQINFVDVDLSSANIWGHITDPEVRFVKGVAEYLSIHKDVDYDNPVISRMLVSGTYDPHTYTIHTMYGHLMKYNITWLPLNDTVTNEYFSNQNLNMVVESTDHYNRASEEDLLLRDKVKELIKLYNLEYRELVKYVLQPDITLFNNAVKSSNK